MLTDNQTNFLYLAGKLKKGYPEFFQEFDKVLKDCKIAYEFLPYTKDIWAVDFMPVQVNRNKFISFRFKPDYLRGYPHLKTNPDKVLSALNLKTIRSEIILDGGNVIKAGNKIIMCDKVFHENKCLKKTDVLKLISELEEYFEIDKIIFIPWDTGDYTGHADGMVRFIDDNTVIINDYNCQIDKGFQITLRAVLHNSELDYVEIPCNIQNGPDSAAGLYINYLQMEQAVLMPVFNLKSDEKAYKNLSGIFSNKKVVTVECSDIAAYGGVLNCISWNIKK